MDALGLVSVLVVLVFVVLVSGSVSLLLATVFDLVPFLVAVEALDGVFVASFSIVRCWMPKLTLWAFALPLCGELAREILVC